MSKVALLGDSIIDNKVYVGPDEFSVREHLESLSDLEFSQIAVDGHTTVGVLEEQIDKIEKDTDRDYFLSAEEAKNYGLIDRVISHPSEANQS